MLWYDLDLNCDLAVVTLTFKILSGLYHKGQEVDTWYGHWSGCIGVHHHGVTLI